MNLPILRLEICHRLLQLSRLRLTEYIHSESGWKVVAVVTVERRNLIERICRQLEHCIDISSG